MSQSLEITRSLHEEHKGTLVLLGQIEAVIFKFNRPEPPDLGDEMISGLLRQLETFLQDEMEHHFGFEEQKLFPILNGMGDSAMGDFLTAEHHAMRGLAMEALMLLGEAWDTGFTADSWERFRDLGQEINERMVEHIQKEEVGLLPALEVFIDSEADASLAAAYARTPVSQTRRVS